MKLKVMHYDVNKNEIMGSDGYLIPDGRKTIKTIIDSYLNNELTKFNPKKITYIRIFTGTLLYPHYITDFIKIN